MASVSPETAALQFESAALDREARELRDEAKRLTSEIARLDSLDISIELMGWGYDLTEPTEQQVIEFNALVADRNDAAAKLNADFEAWKTQAEAHNARIADYNARIRQRRS
jgi:predicted  nucleic acid-binding Zn-ribbon protein